MMLRNKQSRHASKAKKAASEAAREDILRQLHQAVRNACRHLKRNPAALNLMHAHAASSRTENFAYFTDNLSQLTLVTHRKLSTTVEEESVSKTRMHELSERERSAEEERNALEETLDVQRSDREQEISTLDHLITKLRSELHDITQTNQIEMESIRQEMKSQLETAESDHASKSKKLQDRIDKLTQELATESEKHREHEASLRKKKEKKEADLSGRINQFDEDMTAKETEIEQLKKLMAEEGEELRVLEEYFAKIDANNKTKENEERVLAEFKRRVAAAKEVLDRAAVMVQKVARGRKTRAEQKAAGGKKKKKGKKGKKGK